MCLPYYNIGTKFDIQALNHKLAWNSFYFFTVCQVMENSSTSSFPTFSCSDANLSRNSVNEEYWENSTLSDDFSANSTATAVIMLIFLLVGLPANTIIIISIIYQRLYKETTHILLLNLAISDLLFCLLVMPFVMIIVAGFAGGYIFGDSDYVRCQVCKSSLTFTALTLFSVYILGLMSIDRFIFIKFPLRYNRYVTVCRVIFVVIILWLLSILVAILPLFGIGDINFSNALSACNVDYLGESELLGQDIYYAIMVVGMALIPVIIIIVLNICIACIAGRHIKNIYKTRKSFGNVGDLKTYNNKLRTNVRKKRNKKQLALIRVFGAIVAANFIVWIPVSTIATVFLVVDRKDIPLGIVTFTFNAFVLHSVLHPIIEGCFIPEIK